ncbi:MAG TPA: preprotein translocase subunit SecY [Verrucomicrobia bacterium]|nr:preprotein translocase subunit SecY [Verrucomicrobiota bacterium]
MFKAIINAFKIPELRQRILFTLGLIFVTRLIALVPSPGVNAVALQQVIDSIAAQAGGGIMGMIDLFSGGALGRCAVGALGIMPYISASIIIQLMTAVIPQLERLAREGDTGRAKITQYTRYLTLIICVVQGFLLALTLEQGFGGVPGGDQIVSKEMSGMGFRLLTVLTTTTGTMLLMWLGEQITERGIGNGISIVITVNILSGLPTAVSAAVALFSQVGGQALFGPFEAIGLVAMMFLVTAGTVALTEALRKIPIHTTRRVVGNKVYGGQNTYMPLRINYSGVMPIIFASAILVFPAAILMKISSTRHIGMMLQNGSPLYLTVYSLMVLFFSYFWVATQFNPLQIADDLKKSGGYIPGIRPGRPTADFLDMTMTRLTLVGALFLTAIAVLPSVLSQYFDVPPVVSDFMGGTSLLIIVGVSLDTVRQIESHLVMRNYDGFLRHGRIRGRA